ncbi:MAG: hypothetical protein IPL28_25210 [Chloroflexi bacterium]|nr:hypothetical protein [Chloroflexota bacterium]
MIPTSFSALTVTALNNGTTTFAVDMGYDHLPMENRLVETIAGVYDTRGTQTSRRKPGVRQVRYIFEGATAADLHSHINTLEFTDKGKKGTLTLTRVGGATTYTCTAALTNIAVAFLSEDNPDETAAVITLFLAELTALAQA